MGIKHQGDKCFNPFCNRKPKEEKCWVKGREEVEIYCSEKCFKNPNQNNNMANPFKVKGNTKCQNCKIQMQEGDTGFYHDGKRYCEECAESLGLKCPNCGNYKKPDFKSCFVCFQERKNKYDRQL